MNLKLSTFNYPWRLERRASPFHPWVVWGLFKTIEDAAQKHDELRAGGSGILLRIRAR